MLFTLYRNSSFPRKARLISLYKALCYCGLIPAALGILFMSTNSLCLWIIWSPCNASGECWKWRELSRPWHLSCSLLPWSSTGSWSAQIQQELCSQGPSSALGGAAFEPAAKDRGLWDGGTILCLRGLAVAVGQQRFLKNIFFPNCGVPFQWGLCIPRSRASAQAHLLRNRELGSRKRRDSWQNSSPALVIQVWECLILKGTVLPVFTFIILRAKSGCLKTKYSKAGKTSVWHQVNLNLNNTLMFYSRFPYLSPITKTHARKLHPDCHWSTSRSDHLCFWSQISTSDEHKYLLLVSPSTHCPGGGLFHANSPIFWKLWVHPVVVCVGISAKLVWDWPLPLRGLPDRSLQPDRPEPAAEPALWQHDFSCGSCGSSGSFWRSLC